MNADELPLIIVAYGTIAGAVYVAYVVIRDIIKFTKYPND